MATCTKNLLSIMRFARKKKPYKKKRVVGKKKK